MNISKYIKDNNSLVIYKKDKIIKEIHDIQPLYLFPLTLADYANNLLVKDNIYNILKLDILQISNKMEDLSFFDKKMFNYLKCVEIVIDDNLDSRVIKIIEYLYQKKIKITLNIKNLLLLNDNFICNMSKYVDYFKIFFPSNLTLANYKKYLNKLSLIKKKKDSLLHIKTYLSLDCVYKYEDNIKDFINLNVDIFQVSKELLPIGTNNINVNNEIQQLIRNLEKKYDDFHGFKFISVKNLSDLYYPRFEIDERNSRVCFASLMKPYLYKEYILPCKVDKVLKNKDDWYLYKDDFFSNNHLKKCGNNCDDCASLFENDILYSIKSIIDKYGKEDLKFVVKGGDSND